MRNKKTTLEEYYRIKVDIELSFPFFLILKQKYISQIPTINHNLYKTHVQNVWP